MKNRRTGILISYGNTILNLFCGLFLSAFFLRILGDTEYGLYKTMVSFVGMLAMFEFGTGTVMTRNITLCRGKKEKKEIVDQNISTLWTITNILAVVIALFAVGFLASIDTIYQTSLTPGQIQYSRWIFFFAAVYLVLNFYNQTLNGIVLAFEYYSFASLVSLLRCVIRTAVLTALILSYRYSILIVITDMVIEGVITLGSFWFCKKKCSARFTMKLCNADVFRNSLPLCLAIFLQGIVNQANNNVDNFLIGVQLNPESVALYSVALYIYNVFSSAATIPICMYAPQVVTDVAKGLRGKMLTDTLVPPCRLVAFVGGSILFGFVAAGRPFLSLVYGESYIQAWSVALLIMGPMFINATNGVIINVLDALNKRMVRSLTLLLTTALNVLLTVIWLNQWGVLGAACATAVSTILGQIFLMNLYYSKKLGLHIMHLFRQAYKGILPFQILGAAAALYLQRYIDSLWGAFLACGMVYAIVAIGGYLLFGCSMKERAFLKKLADRVIK